ncbi:YifB family Mg chelatase-like AAA ATPase [Veillonella sp. R32]|uniref:YifB family Mg chelatase-like AAA ATPase n=1 Tax=Veillonella sp. R32 TaxID=2021312 RepID=UPI001389825D|nr:YifB family Mg chelatase-like AAA ATPase [Veillonella sp. R32]KAF1682014.1 ATP-dependent protease [Veillonella sp. R32]
MYAKTKGIVLMGLDSEIITVEVDIAAGLPCFEIVGLPTAAVREAKERVRAAIRNAGFEFPMRRIVINLAPADIRKDGSGLDLAMAMGILLAAHAFKLKKVEAQRFIEESLFIGELSLEGYIKGVNGGLAMAMGARAKGVTTLYTAPSMGCEIKSGFDGEVVIANTLADLVNMVTGRVPRAFAVKGVVSNEASRALPDFKDVQGQVIAKKALEIAAAGGHHVLLSGSPGAGKTMLARAMPSILPPLTDEEQLTISQIYSVAGLLPATGLVQHRPFRSPHHTITLAGMAGGGSVPKPGELTLSHGGVLFLDEAPEFSRSVLEVLRQPLEEGLIHIARARGNYAFPCRFILLMAMNPCPCGWYHSGDGHICTCTPWQRENYRRRLSGPLLDRLDMVIEVARPKYEEFCGHTKQETSATIRERVIQARQFQAWRLQQKGIIETVLNSELTHAQLIATCELSSMAEAMLAQVFQRLQVSIRSYDKILRVARTIADLKESTTIQADYVAEALSYRMN